MLTYNMIHLKDILDVTDEMIWILQSQCPVGRSVGAGVRISNFQSSSRLSVLIRDFQKLELLIETDGYFHIPCMEKEEEEAVLGWRWDGVNNLIKCNKAI